ncbi:hypothetical protein CJ030_MR8G008030 [Morella rubra]|uniref:Uncharacterized protein n=1 Tax=Morella rubra TaxID=262757 RepID=A0A6A1UR23_9ROSI|nr:hypothetical protein CJ030_MR8G008030 [Morella rubra]
MDYHYMRGDLSVFTRDPSGIYGAVEADWNIPYCGDGEQARCERHFLFFHEAEHGASGTLRQQKFMLPFWRILYLIFAYDIEPRAHTTECPIMRGKLMLGVTRGCVVDLPLYIFLSLLSEAKITSSAALSYNLLMTQFLHSVGCMDGSDEERKAPIGPICRTTLSHSKPQLRRQ